MDLKQYGPWAFIAGGSEGVASSFAHKLAASGINLVLCARRRVPLDALAAELRSRHTVEVRTLPLDLRNPDMLARVREATDEIDIGLLIYNAGALDTMMGGFLNRQLDSVLTSISVNVIGSTILTHHFGGRMVARGRGGILLVGSVSGNAGIPLQATYSGAKAYCQIFAEALWSELKPCGIDVLCLVLGAVDTPARTSSDLVAPDGTQFLTADEAANEGLMHLADGGPVHVPPAYDGIFHYLSGAARRQIVEQVGLAMTSVQADTT